MIGYSYDKIDVQLLSIANDYDPGRTVEYLWFFDLKVQSDQRSSAW